MENTFIEKLNPSQKEAVLCTEGPLIIFAGAGTGKTGVITCRIAHLLSKGVYPQSVLAVTFTNKAAEEMKKRVNDLMPGLGANVWISTFHSFCAYFLRIEASKIGLSPDFLIYDYADQKNTIKDCLKELALDEKKFKPSTIADKISRAKDDLKFPSDMALEAENSGDFFSLTIANVYRLYQKKLEQAQALDFGDLILRTVTALRQYPALLEHYKKRFQYIMVDEYQDTNHAQYVLTKLLAQGHRNICVVGDDDQSVYSWRGADINNILDFEKDYPEAKSVKLEQNYRSTPKILSTAWQVVKHNTNRVEKKLWTNNSDDGSVSVVRADDANDEASKVTDLIMLKNNDSSNFSDFAVFCRTNAQSRVFEEAFRRAGLPYTIVGTLRFYERAEIKNIMAYLKLTHNPNDNVSLKRIINVPSRGIGKTSVENLEKEAIKRGLSLWQTIPYAAQAGLKKSAVSSFNSFAELINGFMKLKETETVKSIAQKIITHCGYMQELEAEKTPEADAKIENIKELVSAINDFEQRSPDKTLSGYLTQTALISDIDSFDETQGKVTIMTLHLAKGLEFKNVFICGLEDGLFPIGESAFDPKELEEERRLMYVGMTRAKKNLYLCWAAERTVYGKRHWNIPSRFIAEAGFKEEFADRQNDKGSLFGGSFGKTFNGNYGYSLQKKYKAEYKYRDDDSYDYIPSDDEIINQDKPLYTPTSDSSPFQIGIQVSHPVFGKGKIIEKSGSGDDLKLVVLFENGQWKRLLARVSNLSLI